MNEKKNGKRSAEDVIYVPSSMLLRDVKEHAYIMDMTSVICKQALDPPYSNFVLLFKSLISELIGIFLRWLLDVDITSRRPILVLHFGFDKNAIILQKAALILQAIL